MSEARAMTYGDYLSLEPILSAQHPISEQHDELLFIVIHQTKELWLKQILREIELSSELIRADSLIQVHKSLSRVSRIQAVMTLSWDVLATMTPSDYSSFRDVLGSSSGFQSWQFRTFEYRLGLKDGSHVRFQQEGSAAREALVAALRSPSLWDEANAALARAGFDLPLEALARDWSEPYRPHEKVEEAWAEVYREPERWWPLYQLAEKLVDIDDSLATWRHKHVVTVERIIGAKRGTGGTAGVAYLQSTIGKRAFPELWSLRTRI
ncbi:tryptophan 2,3-dioxygenase [Sphingomonas parva]|uniref:Tryptophan 2,3-dioxygenase n=1 Tax=Sphingomonas parva TaxID=2555898 RepID=A0A4Y8ZMF9_9SPHN|nr:tryptophan 2,3-dioxygenase [Sphingomonas parva]TFI57203.1 tryptophan 2,3-dioxygenase [Sphingomonas parva]